MYPFEESDLALTENSSHSHKTLLDWGSKLWPPSYDDIPRSRKILDGETIVVIY